MRTNATDFRPTLESRRTMIPLALLAGCYFSIGVAATAGAGASSEPCSVRIIKVVTDPVTKFSSSSREVAVSVKVTIETNSSSAMRSGKVAVRLSTTGATPNCTSPQQYYCTKVNIQPLPTGTGFQRFDQSATVTLRKEFPTRNYKVNAVAEIEFADDQSCSKSSIPVTVALSTKATPGALPVRVVTITNQSGEITEFTARIHRPEAATGGLISKFRLQPGEYGRIEIPEEIVETRQTITIEGEQIPSGTKFFQEFSLEAIASPEPR